MFCSRKYQLFLYEWLFYFEPILRPFPLKKFGINGPPSAQISNDPPWVGKYNFFLDPNEILNTYNTFIQILVPLRFKNVEVWRFDVNKMSVLFLGGPHFWMIQTNWIYV